MPITPTDIPNLWAWYKSDAGVDSNFGTVLSWEDQSGNVRTLTPPPNDADLIGEPFHSPFLQTDAINDFPAVGSYSPDGGDPSTWPVNPNSWLRTVDTISGAATAITVYLVMRQHSFLSNDDTNGVALRSGPIVKVSRNSSNNSIATAFKGGSPLVVSAVNNTWYTLSCRFGGSTQSARLNNEAEVTDSFSFFSGADAVLNIWGTPVPGIKQFAEILVYLDDHDAETQAEVRYYLQQRYDHYTWNDPIPGETQAVINFPALPTKTVGDSDFAPGATSNSPAAITYESSNPAVATIIMGLIRIEGAGTSTITASQDATTGYTAAANVSRTLTVNNQTNNTMAEVDNGLQGTDVIIRLRVAGTNDDFKRLVCEVDNQIQLTNDVSETDTKCGTFVGVKDAKANISGNAVYNTVPTSFEVSYADVAGWQLDKTLLEYEYLNDQFQGSGGTVNEGDVFFYTGTARFVDSTFTGTTGEVSQFSWTLKPSTITNIMGS